MTRNKKLTIAMAIVLPVVVLGSGIVAATSTPELVVPDTSSDATYAVASVSSGSTTTASSPCDDCTGDCSGSGACDGDCEGKVNGTCDGDCNGSGDCDGSGNCAGTGICDGDCTAEGECGYLGCTGSGDCDNECADKVAVTSPCGSSSRGGCGGGGSCSK